MFEAFVVEKIVRVIHRGPEGAEGVLSRRDMFMGKIKGEFVSTVYLVCECMCVCMCVGVQLSLKLWLQ